MPCIEVRRPSTQHVRTRVAASVDSICSIGYAIQFPARGLRRLDGIELDLNGRRQSPQTPSVAADRPVAPLAPASSMRERLFIGFPSHGFQPARAYLRQSTRLSRSGSRGRLRAKRDGSLPRSGMPDED